MVKINKFLALLLCMVMLVGMMPMQAFATGDSPDSTAVETQPQEEEPVEEPQEDVPAEVPQEEDSVVEPQEEDPVEEPQAEPAAVTDVQVTATGEDVVKVVDGEGNETFYASFDAAMKGEFGGGIYTYGGTYTFTLLEDTSSSGESWSLRYPKEGTTVNLTIDLNGHTIQGDSTKVVLCFDFGTSTSGIVTIQDSVGTGKITGGKQGVYFTGKNSTLNFNGGTITGNHGNTNGAGIYCGATALLNLNGGVITGNSVTNSSSNKGLGGGVCANQLNLNGTIITGNAANGSKDTLQSGRGGGIAVEITGTKGYSVVKINTNTVYGNTATNAGDDLMIAKNGLSGTIHTLVIGTENWYIDGWNGVSAAKGQTARYSEENPVPYTDGGFTDQYKINLGLKYVVNTVSYTVTYTDGVEDEVVFEDQTYTVEEDKPTPAFEGTPTRKGYVFDGWDPEVAETVTDNVTYTAKWVECTHTWDNGVYDGDTHCVTCTCTVCGETKTMDVVAQVKGTGVYYETLQDAINAADNDTVLILKDLDIGTVLSVKNTVTVTADKAVTLTRTSYNDVFDVYANAKLTLEGPVTLVGSTKNGTMVDVLKSGTFVMNDGVTIKDNVMGKNGYAGGVTVTDGSFVMNGGTIDNCGNTTANKPGTTGGGAMGGGVRIIATSRSTVPATFVMNGGAITNCSAYLGGGIGLENKGSSVPASVTIYDGTISGCSCTGKSANYRGGAAIYIYNKTTSLEDATVTMYGGTITGNTAKYNAALCMYTGTNSTQTYGGKFYILGGTITGNVSGNGNPSSGYGNGIYLDRLVNGKPLLTVGGNAVIDSDILLKGTNNYIEIQDDFTGSVKVFVQAAGTGSDGEAYYGTLVAKQVSATGVASTATKEIAGRIIAVYPFVNEEGKVYEHPSYDVVLSQTAADEYVLGEYPNYFTVTYTDGVEDEVVFEDQTYTVEEGDPTPAFEGTLTRKGYVFDGWTPAVAETVTADVTYTATWKECTHVWDEGTFNEETLAWTYTCTVCGETKEVAAVAKLESTGEYFPTLQEAVTAADTYSKTLTENHDQTVTLVGDTTECVKISYSPNRKNYYHYTLNIDLNGHTVTGDGTGSVFTVSRYTSYNYNLTVVFNDSVGTGKVTGGNTTKNGGAINVDSSKLCYVVINGGTWTGNHADKNGGAIWSSGQTACPVTINGGVFTGNTAGGNGGAFHIRNLTMTGGTVTGNSAVNGGGLYSYCTYSQILNMTGGAIYGNTATTAGDDIVWRADKGNKTTSYLTLVDASFMGIGTVNGWYFDNADARYDSQTAEEFTDYAKYTTQKTLICLKAALDKTPDVPEKWGDNVMEPLVKTICDSDENHGFVTSDWSAVNCQVFPTTSTPVWDAELGAWTIGIRIQSLETQYVTKLEKANNRIHHDLVGDSLMLATLKWDKAQQLWVTLDGQPLEVHATCKTKPSAPEFRQLSSYQIQVFGQVGFETKLYAINLNKDSVTVGEVQGNRQDGFTVNVTVAIAEDDAYQSGWLAKRAPENTLADYTYDWAKTPTTITFTLKYTGDLDGTLFGNRHASNTNYDWVLSTTGKHFGKVGEAYLIPTEPSTPTQDTVTDEFVKVICDSDPDRHASVYGKWYPTCCKTVSGIAWSDEMNAWIVDVKIGSLYTTYVRQLERANNNITHELVDDITTVYATLKWDVTAQQWVPSEPIELHTTCRTEPLAPVYSQLEAYQIKVHGDVDGNGVYGDKGETWTTSIPENGYTLSEVYGSREEGFYVDVTVNLADGDLYQTRWIEKCDPAHFYKYNWDKTEKTITFTLRYNGSLTGTLYGNRHAANTNYDWVLDTTGKTWGVVSQAYVDKVMCTVQVVIYRNGDTAKPYKTVTLDKAAKGDTLDLTTLNIADYYSSSNGFEFEGWFNDGRWNQYKAGQDVTGLDEIYINGWTNLICMVTDYQVVQVQIYRNGDTTKPYKTVALDKMLKGDTLDLTTLDIADYYSSTYGYDFYGWFNDGRWNQYKAGQTVTGMDEIYINGWTNVICMVYDYQKVVVKAVTNGDKANAEVIFTGTAPKGNNLVDWLNANVEVAEKDGYTLDKWYNWDWYGHKYEDTRTVNGWTNVYVTYTGNAHTITLDANGGYFAVTLDAESNTTVTVSVNYGMPVGELPVPLRDGYTFEGWFDADGNEVTAETVYNVDGDMTLTARWTVNTYTVTLNANGGTVEPDTLTVTYGDVITLPTPTREGYTFEGWLDADGTLMASGSAYTFAYDSNLTAKWSENEVVPTEDPTEESTTESTEKETTKATETTTEPADSTSPRTGDSTILFFTVMMLVSAAAILYLADRQRRMAK